MTASKIEWTGRSDWNPIRGCTRASTGCINCYAEIMAARFSLPGQWGNGYARMVDTPQGRDHRWTGKVELIEERLTLPLGWKTPGFVFPSSTSDIFHEALTEDEIDLIFAVMALTPHLTYQLLTKRTARMRDYFDRWRAHAVWRAMYGVAKTKAAGAVLDSWYGGPSAKQWPLPNVWLGTSVEDQRAAEDRLPDLVEIPAALRWVSFEPLIGSVNAAPWMPGIGWAVVGGESGPGARDNDFLTNARSLRDQCAAAGVPFFGKQNFKKAELPADLQIREMPV